MTVSAGVHESRDAQVEPRRAPRSPAAASTRGGEENAAKDRAGEVAAEGKRLPETRRDGSDRFEIRCRRCGYGGVVVELPARCPMCGVCAWVVTGQAKPALAAAGGER